MWISLTAWTRWLEEREHERAMLVDDIVTLRAENLHLHETVAQKIRDVDWMRVRCNQLEQERAALLMKLNGVIVPTPMIVQELNLTPKEQTAIQQMDLVGGEAPE